jgi:hypothetical protein
MPALRRLSVAVPIAPSVALYLESEALQDLEVDTPGYT